MRKLIRSIKGLVSTMKECAVQVFCYQLIVPEYKARHVCSNLMETVDWMKKYPKGTTKMVLFPKWDWL
jgi:hypothetical protein